MNNYVLCALDLPYVRATFEWAEWLLKNGYGVKFTPPTSPLEDTLLVEIYERAD